MPLMPEESWPEVEPNSLTSFLNSSSSFGLQAPAGQRSTFISEPPMNSFLRLFIVTFQRAPNAGHQRRARTGTSDKPCIRNLLIARPLHAIVKFRAPSLAVLFVRFN